MRKGTPLATEAVGRPHRTTHLFVPVHEASWAAVVVVLLLQIGCGLLINAFLFQGNGVMVLRQLQRATGGLVAPTLVANLILLAVVAGWGIFVMAHLRPADLGARWHALPLAAGVTAGFWLVLQVVFALVAMAQGGLRLHPTWTAPGAGYVIGGLLGQLGGNALLEEAVFRGFLFPQLWLKLRRRFSARTALILAAVVSQAGFAVWHLPNRLLVDGVVWGPALALELGRLFVNGLLFLALFVATGNLFVAVGVHALWNVPAFLFVAPDGPLAYAVFAGGTLALVVAWRLRVASSF